MKISTTLILLFMSALGFSLILTPVIRTIGIRLGAMDIPLDRNVHTKPIPRIGGIAVFLSCTITLLLAIQILPRLSRLYIFNCNTVWGYLGAVVVLCCGLWDDFRSLKPWTKLFFQIAAATMAFIGGAKITGFFVGSYGIQFNIYCSYLVTVFWFLLFINAVNLIDGLDGLASGLVFFTCLVMMFSSYFHSEYLAACYFTILGGAVLGFLRYNFNPATIFLGDGGSYFLGYIVAILAILSSSKSHVGTLMLIPLLALGVPIFDSVLSPIRRFIRGKSIFQADKGHIHHVFLKMGLSSRSAVLLIYGITMGLCLLAILMTIFRGKGFEGIILALLLFGMMFLVRKLGYLEYLAFDKFYGWFRDVTDVTGISQNRRSFLSLQIAANNVRSIDELWETIIDALEMLSFDKAHLHLGTEPARRWKRNKERVEMNPELLPSNKSDADYFDSIMKVEIPLINEVPETLGKLILIKDLKLGQLQPYTMRRVESLRITIISNLTRLKKDNR